MSPNLQFTFLGFDFNIYFSWRDWTVGIQLPTEYTNFMICLLPLAISIDNRKGR